MPPCSSTMVCVKFMESANACQTPLPSVAKLTATSAATVAAAAPIVLQRPPANSATGISTPNCGL